MLRHVQLPQAKQRTLLKQKGSLKFSKPAVSCCLMEILMYTWNSNHSSLITPFLWILRVFCHHLRLGVLSAGAAAARQVPRRARPLQRTRPSSGWKLLKQLPLLQLPQPVLPTVLVQPIDEPVTLVDCGSGSTRALFFTDDGLSHVSWEKSDWRGWTVTNFSLGLPIVAYWFCRGRRYCIKTVSNLYQGASLAREYQFFMMNHPDVYHLQHVCVRLVSLVSLVYWRILFLFLAHQYAPGDPLAVALGDDLKLESLLRLLENELPKTGRVLLGATAGVRQAMQDNTDMFSSLKVSLWFSNIFDPVCIATRLAAPIRSAWMLWYEYVCIYIYCMVLDNEIFVILRRS